MPNTIALSYKIGEKKEKMASRIMGGLMSAAEAFPSKLIDEGSAESSLQSSMEVGA